MQVLPPSFIQLQNTLLTPAGLRVDEPVVEHEISDYAALTFQSNEQTFLFRQAKQTPKKIGQFVTLWKRETPDSEIAPFDINDDIDWVLVLTNEAEQQGIFVFSQTLLASRSVFSVNGNGGKRAMRVYAPWTTPSAAQAQRTQKWQCSAFLNITGNPTAARQLTDLLSLQTSL